MILLSIDGADEVNAASALMIVTLGADFGAAVTVESENAAAVAEIAAMIAKDLDGWQVFPPKQKHLDLRVGVLLRSSGGCQRDNPPIV